ncbi:hypothetical protein EDB19DRAFT_1908289 [Suillus lakei]|nr:hypothetical protein EDB19DRAFT_1908289 [Suillus lakei]
MRTYKGRASVPDTQIPVQMHDELLPIDHTASTLVLDTQDDLDDKEEEEEVTEQASRSLQDVLLIADDFAHLTIHGNAEEVVWVTTLQ